MKSSEKLALSAILLLGVTQALILFVHRLMTNGDNLDYLFIAGAVLNGEWLEPFRWRFPPGYPFLIAAFCKLTGLSIATDPLQVSAAAVNAIKLLGVAMAPLSVWAVWRWLRGRVEEPALAWLLLALFATSQHVAPLFSVIGTEPYFLVLSWLALGWWERAFAETAEARGRLIAAAAAATVGAFLFRQMALAIPVAVLGLAVWCVVRGVDHRRVRAPALAALAVLGGCLLWMAASNASHLGQLSSAGAGAGEAARTGILAEKLSLIRDNADAYRWVLPGLLLPKVFGGDGLLARAGLGVLAVPLALLMSGFFLAGLIRILMGQPRAALGVMYVLVTAAVLLVWPYRDGRFAMPLLPALWVIAITGVSWLASVSLRRPAASRGAVLAGLALLLVWQFGTNAYAGVKNVRAMQRLEGLPPWHPERYETSGELDFAGHLDCGAWLAAHAPADAVVFAEKAAFIALSSGHRTDYLGLNIDHLFAAPPSSGAVYAVVDTFPATAGYGRPKHVFLERVARGDAAFARVYDSPYGASVYRRSK